MDIESFKYSGRRKFDISEVNTGEKGEYETKQDAKTILEENIELMAELQDKLYSQDRYAVLIVLQAMDTAGKDGIIKHAMSGLNPQGTQVYSFKQPSSEELDHDYLWRVNKNLPERGRIGIFNRSYYEEVLVVRVHNLIKSQKIPPNLITENIWDVRYRQIRDYERYLFENGIVPVKLFLNISKKEQAQRLLERIDNKGKNWKFSEADITEREYWSQYQKCYEEMIENTGTDYAPWYIIPSDHKWYSRLLVSEIINKTMQNLQLKYPEVSKDHEEKLEFYKNKLMEELK